MPVLTEQRKPQVGAVWQPQRHAACGHLLAGAAGGSPGGRRAVERAEHAAQAAQTSWGPEPRKGRPERRCGGDYARPSLGGRCKEGRLREDVGGPELGTSNTQNVDTTVCMGRGHDHWEFCECMMNFCECMRCRSHPCPSVQAAGGLVRLATSAWCIYELQRKKHRPVSSGALCCLACSCAAG